MISLYVLTLEEIKFSTTFKHKNLHAAYYYERIGDKHKKRSCKECFQPVPSIWSLITSRERIMSLW